MTAIPLMRGGVRSLLPRGAHYAGFALGLLLVLTVVSVLVNPVRWTPAGLSVSLGIAAPLVLLAIASTPPILAGGGGLDLSVGPTMGIVNVFVVHVIITQAELTSPFLVVPLAVLLGASIGVVNGVLAAVVRLQPIVATLGTYLVLGGLAIWILPTPGGSVPPWLAGLSGPASIIPVGVVLLAWWGLSRTIYYANLMASGSDERAAYASGVQVTQVRILAYTIGGAVAGVAGLSLSALLTSADPTVGPFYTLIAIGAVALGGVSLAGGRGGVFGAVVGALAIFLLRDLLTFVNVSTFALQTVFGGLLVGAVVLNTTLARRWSSAQDQL